jgi:Flp pilus assembly protein TadD
MLQVEESVAIFETAIAMQPEVPDYHSNLAVSYMRLKRWDEAREALLAALEIQPGHPLALKNLAELDYYVKPMILIGGS